MKQNILLATLVAITTQISATDIKINSDKFNEIRSMNKILQQPELQIKDGIEIDNTYFLKIEVKSKRGSRIITAFVDKNTSRVYFGNGFDKDGRMVSFPADIAVVKDGISFSYGSGKEDIYLVTDPECSYCSKFEREMDGKLGNYTVHVILYPLPFHKKAPAMVEWIMRGEDDAQKHKRFKELMLGKSTKYKSIAEDDKKAFKYTTKVHESVTKSKEAVEELGARGTPMVFDSSLKQIPRTLLKLKSSDRNNSTNK